MIEVPRKGVHSREIVSHRCFLMRFQATVSNEFDSDLPSTGSCLLLWLQKLRSYF